MPREIDESFIAEAIERYQRLDTRLAEFDRAVSTAEVTVTSPDGTVEVVITADGTIRDVTIADNAELSRSVRQAVVAAADAAAWARGKLRAETFGERSLEHRPLFREA